MNEYLIREASTEKSLKIWCWGPRGELSNIKCVIRLSRYPAHAQTLLQHIHTERSAFAQSPRTSYRSQNTLNPVFLCFNIYSNLHGSTSTFIKIQFDVLGLFLSDLMVETRESVGNPRSKIWVESSRYLSRWVLGDPSLILQRWEFWTMVDPGNRFQILCLLERALDVRAA